MLLAGCSDYRDGTRSTQVAAASLPHCASSAKELPAFDGWGRIVGSGQVPDGFRPVRVVRCTWDEHYIDDAATRLEIRLEESRSPSISTELSASLELPDQEFARFSNMACPAIALSPQYLIFIDAAGRAVMPRLPESPCGDPRDEVARALADVKWMEHESYRFEATRR